MLLSPLVGPLGKQAAGWEIVQVHKVCNFVLLITAITTFTCTQNPRSRRRMAKGKELLGFVRLVGASRSILGSSALLSC